MLLYYLIIAPHQSQLLVDQFLELFDGPRHLLEGNWDPHRDFAVQQQIKLVALFTVAHDRRALRELQIVEVTADQLHVPVPEGKFLPLSGPLLEKFDLFHLASECLEVLGRAIIRVLDEDAANLLEKLPIALWHFIPVST